MIKKELHLILQEKKRKYFFTKSFNFKLIMIYSLTSNYLTNFLKQRTKLLLSNNFYKYSQYRPNEMCLVSGRKYAVSKMHKTSRFNLRRLTNDGYVSGYRRAVW